MQPREPILKTEDLFHRFADGTPGIEAVSLSIQSGEFVYSTASGYTWTPAFASFGDNNRTQLFRCPDPNRFEDRSPSAMVNPYLLLAAHMAAGAAV